MDVNRWMDGWMDDGCECELLNNLNNQSKNDATKKRMMGYVCVCVYLHTHVCAHACEACAAACARGHILLAGKLSRQANSLLRNYIRFKVQADIVTMRTRTHV